MSADSKNQANSRQHSVHGAFGVDQMVKIHALPKEAETAAQAKKLVADLRG